MKNLNATFRRDQLAVLSFHYMRWFIGILGISIGFLLPVTTAIFSDCNFVQSSISHYYYTIAGDVFVGLLCVVAFFLIFYPGEGRMEDIWTNVAGFCALAVAFFPTEFGDVDINCKAQPFISPPWVYDLHLYSAAAFFLILGGVAVFQFSKIKVKMTDQERKARIIFYRVCGAIMLLSVIGLSPMALSDNNEIASNYSIFLYKHQIVFYVEVIALVFFGFCWLVKGTESYQE